MPAGRGTPILSPLGILLVALSLSIGWGIRGNYGHETGAMFPGAVAAIAVALLSGRADWQRRVAFFAFFGALGWAFGGSVSYMQVIAYTHSGHLPSQVYGFACLYVIGFLWGGLGGAGTALPGCPRSAPPDGPVHPCSDCTLGARRGQRTDPAPRCDFAQRRSDEAARKPALLVRQRLLEGSHRRGK